VGRSREWADHLTGFCWYGIDPVMSHRVKQRRGAACPPVCWVPEPDGHRIRRSEVNSGARQATKPATLAWLRKHGKPSVYRVRWWEGPTSTQGEWRTYEMEASQPLTDVKAYAAAIAAHATAWEVEITLIGTTEPTCNTHGERTGGGSRSLLWTFGHYKRDDDASRALRGE